MTSSILPPRSVLAPCSPMTQASASTTLDLPDPLGPTMQVTPGSNAKVVGCAKDLKPLSVRLFRYTSHPPLSARTLRTTVSEVRTREAHARRARRKHLLPRNRSLGSLGGCPNGGAPT